VQNSRKKLHGGSKKVIHKFLFISLTNIINNFPQNVQVKKNFGNQSIFGEDKSLRITFVGPRCI